MLVFTAYLVFVVGDAAVLGERIWKKLRGSGLSATAVEIPSVGSAGAFAEDDP